MGILFKDALQDQFGTWPLGYIPYGGADFGEVLAVANAVGDGDDAAFFQTWCDAGDRLGDRAHAALKDGRRSSARDAFLRASCHYAASYHLLFGAPVDPRLVAAFRKQMAAFDAGLALLEPAVAPLRIPLNGHAMPAYFVPAAGRPNEVRPLVILTNGYDATVTDLYFASAVAATRRGYHCLFFDGPGQGELLYEHGVHLRPDWENVIRPVVDFALTLDRVDPQRIALIGWSLGGYLAPRAASGEQRLAACVADPGFLGIAPALRQMMIGLGATPAGVADLRNVDQAVLDKVEAMLSADRRLHWTFVQRGYWVHGVDDLRAYLGSVEDYTLEGRLESITCPTLLTQAENDPLAAGAQDVLDALRSPRRLVKFTAAQGADRHTEAWNRSLLNATTFDWLDGVFA